MKKLLFAGMCALALLASCGDNDDPITPDNPNPENPTDSVKPSKPQGTNPYVTKVLDYRPAPGQFVNTLPQYSDGDTQDIMNAKALVAIGNNKKGMVTLGGYGGYITVGFDHTIKNEPDLCDFRVLGNAFVNAPSSQNPYEGGSCEAGIIQVAYDANGNGVPDENEWYEIAGSAHVDPTQEVWYAHAKERGNDVNLYRNFVMTYYRPTVTVPDEAEDPDNYIFIKDYIRWKDNYKHSGYKFMNTFHTQPYYPEWIEGDSLVFKGTCLPQNSVNEAPEGSPTNYFVLYKFRYGYADNVGNDADASCIDIDWAVDADGKPANLPGVDFIRVYTGVNQESGWIGECSTEFSGITDLHLTGEKITPAK